MRSLEDINYDLQLTENMLEYCVRTISALENERKEAASKVFKENFDPAPKEMPEIIDEVTMKEKTGHKERCMCSYFRGMLIINPKCKRHST